MDRQFIFVKKMGGGGGEIQLGTRTSPASEKTEEDLSRLKKEREWLMTSSFGRCSSRQLLKRRKSAFCFH